MPIIAHEPIRPLSLPLAPVPPDGATTPTAGGVIVIDRDNALGKWALLDSPASISRLWHRGPPSERALFRAIYDERSWGRSPLYLAPINSQTGVPHGIQRDELGLTAEVVPVLVIPFWAVVDAVVGDALTPDVITLARRRCVLFAPDSQTCKAMVDHDRQIVRRLESAMAFVRERCLVQ